MPYCQRTVWRPRTLLHRQHPNILFILSDDYTSQSWGIYGGHLAPYAQNRHIRRLAAEGVVLDNCYCTNSISVPSRASILTGRYSHNTGVYTLEDSLSTSLPTIATQLQSAGYSTASWASGTCAPSRRDSTTTPSSTTRESTATPPS